MKTRFKKFGFYFLELLVTTGAYVVLIWYFASKEYIFSSYNREISWMIVGLFGIGILMVAYHLFNLYREDRQIVTAHEGLEKFRVDVSRLLHKKHSVTSEMLANNMRKTIDVHFAFLEPSLIKKRIYRIATMILAAHPPEQDMFSHLLQQKEEVKGSRVRYIASILIMIGLLGTFLGLVQALKYLQHFFTATQSVDLSMLFSDMKQTLGGLDKAFGTSIGGMTAYLVLGYLNVVLRTKQAYVLNQIEEMVLEHIIPTLQGFQAETPQGLSPNAVEVLQTIPAALSKQLSTVLEDIMMRAIGESAENLKETGAYLRQAAKGLQEGQHLVTETMNGFENFLATFQEGREQLLASQETIASGVNEFSQALLHLEKNQKMLASSLDMNKNYIENSESRLSALDEVVQHIHNIWIENRQMFERLAEAVQSEHETLVQTAQHFEESLMAAKTEASVYFQNMQHGTHALTEQNIAVNSKLLESHTLLTTLLYEMKSFILDEQNGLRLLTASIGETFGEARFQYLQLTEHLEELYKRIHENQEYLTQIHESTAVIQQQLQTRRSA